jgi:hypothetical protein
MVKCFSKCRNKPRSECLPPKCSYVNGQKRSYCRLAHRYTINDECEPEPRIVKGKQTKRKNNTIESESINDSSNKLKSFERRIKKSNATRKIQKFMKNIKNKNKKEILSISPISQDTSYSSVSNPRSNEEEINEFKEKVKKTNATRKIKKFMKKYEGKRKALFLKTICSDSGVCIAFGKEENKIKKFFDNFNNFDLLSKPAKRIGEVSVNGFVKELTYEKEGYLSNAILKSSTKNDSDNLFYEGLVGQFINKQAKIYPCFVETYGMYYYNSLGAFLVTKNNEFTPSEVLRVGLSKIKDIDTSTFEKSCVDSLKMAILIQHLNDAKTLNDLLKNTPFLKNDLLYILFQVYAPLVSLGTIFTHYDLHTNNVLLYEPVKNSYIEYHYVTKDGQTLSFKSKYIAKIIDYGRSYFNDKSGNEVTLSSKTIYKQLCDIPNCANCGYDKGFQWLQGSPNPDNYFISSSYRNISHDLRLVDYIKAVYGIMIKQYNPSVYKILQRVKYGEGITNPDDKHFGTKENISPGGAYINNLLDIWKYLSGTIIQPSHQQENDNNYASLTKLGDLRVYLNTNKPMEFIPVK